MTPRDLVIAAADLASYLTGETDDWVKEKLALSETSDLGLSVCHGCKLAGCCKQPVLASFLEALPIALHLDRIGANTIVYRERLVAEGERIEGVMERGETDDDATPCAFLSDDHRCLVYAYRPTICRSYAAFGDRSNCTPYPDRTDGRKPKVLTLDHAPVMAAMIESSASFMIESGLSDHRSIWMRALPLSVAIMLEAGERGEYEFWPYVVKHSAMPLDRFMRIAEHQGRDMPERADVGQAVV